MIIGTLQFTVFLHGNRSLKGKRQVANSLKQKMRNKFNVAAAEVESMVEAISPDEVRDVQMEIFSG